MSDETKQEVPALAEGVEATPETPVEPSNAEAVAGPPDLTPGQATASVHGDVLGI